MTSVSSAHGGGTIEPRPIKKKNPKNKTGRYRCRNTRKLEGKKNKLQKKKQMRLRFTLTVQGHHGRDCVEATAEISGISIFYYNSNAAFAN